MANQPDTLNLNYSRLEDVPEEITDDKQYQKHLCKLYLKQNLIENLTPSIAKFKVLTELHLHSNNLVNLPDAIGELSSLTRLNLDSNRLSSLNPCVGKLSNLKYLSISRNDLTTLPEELWKCQNLLSVNASANKISSLDPSIVQCENLQRLDLDCNELVELPPQLCCVRSLRELSFSGNKLESLPGDIHRLSNLSSLLVDAHPKLIGLPANLVFCQSLSVLGIEGCGGDSIFVGKLLNGSTWYIDEVLYVANTTNQFANPTQSLQELAARTVHQRLTVTTCSNWIWSQEELHKQGGDLSPLLKATEKWLTSSPLRVGLCGCHGRETPEQHQLVGSEHSTHSLTECDILLKLQEKDLMLRFDFCSKHCGDAFINFIFNIAS